MDLPLFCYSPQSLKYPTYFSHLGATGFVYTLPGVSLLPPRLLRKPTATSWRIASYDDLGSPVNRAR